MNKPLRIGIAGLGTVGLGVVKLLQAQSTLLEKRCDRDVILTAVSAKDSSKNRGVDLSSVKWYENPVCLAEDIGIDVVCELIGGDGNPAKAIVTSALNSNKHVVTANKALIALHGRELAGLAELNGLALNYEAAIAGGIPIVKALREGLAGNQISRIYGILNGTCNYILSVMRESGRDFEEVLREAQEHGYAETDPAFDIDGIDSAHKLSVLTSLAFGSHINFADIYVDGIRNISALDIIFAEELGYRIKLLAIARPTENGIEQRVHSCMVPLDAQIAHVDGVFNAVVAEGDFVDKTVFIGRGAGEGPTASAVMSDIIDIARGITLPTFSVAAPKLTDAPSAPMDQHNGPYYIRLSVLDQPGVIADVSAVLRDESISIESLLQRARAPGEVVPVVMVTHETEEACLMRAMKKIANLASVQEKPKIIRMEPLD